MATWQPTLGKRQQQHVMFMYNRQGRGEHHNPPYPASFFTQEQGPQQTTKMNEQPR